MELKEKQALVIGTGLSGVGSVKLLLEQGAVVHVLEQNEKVTEEEVREKLRKEDREHVFVHIGALPKDLEDEIVVVIPSPWTHRLSTRSKSAAFRCGAKSSLPSVIL